MTLDEDIYLVPIWIF